MPVLFLSWGDVAPYNTNLGTGALPSVDTGGVEVTFSHTSQDANAQAFTFAADGYVDTGEPFDTFSWLKLFDAFNDDGLAPTSTATLDFASSDPLYTDEVEDVSFRINDIDTGALGDLGVATGSSWEDVITINAFNAAGDPVAVTLTAGSDVSTAGDTATGDGDTILTDASGSVLVEIAGPVQSIEIVYENGEDAQQAVIVSDVYFSTIDADPDVPDAIDDAETTDEDAAITIDVLDNDTDPNGDPLTVVGTTPPSNGGIVVNGDNTITYTPDTGFTGTDTFTYTIEDPDGNSDTATVTVVVSPDNDPPDALPDTATPHEGDPVTVTVLGNDSDPDGDPLTVTGTTPPSNGSIVVNGDNTITYTPDPGFTGTDTFTYTVEDPDGASDTTSVTILVSPDNDPPVATPDSATTPEGDPVIISVLTNDDDPDGDPLTVTGTTPPSNGGVVVNGDNTITYTPDPGFTGTDTFTYTVEDPDGASDTTTVTVTVTDSLEGIDTDVFPVSPSLQPLDPLDNIDEDDDPFDDLDSVSGTAGADSIATGDDADTIESFGGDDTVLPGVDNDLVDLGAGDDSLVDSQGADTIFGRDGDDTIIAGTNTFSDYTGDDPQFESGEFLRDTFGFTEDPNQEDGRDFIEGNLGNDSIEGGDDRDTIDGGADNDTIDGGIDDDLIFGATGDDSLLGSHGSDTIDGGSGDDFIDGSNFDSLAIEDSIDSVPENDRDSLFGALGDDTILGGDDDDTLIGGSGDDLLNGGIDEDSLLGGADDDTLVGGAGDDTLDGGAGLDEIFGGDDRDVIVISEASHMFEGGTVETVFGGAGGDDFDRLDLSAIGVQGVDWRLTDTRTDSDGNGLDGTVEFLDASGAVTGSFEFINIELPCFTPGTMIATATDERRVEDLQPGDRVITRDNGIQQVVWAGGKTLSGAELAANPQLRPVLIRAGALGGGMPEQDLLVSPNHRVLMSGEKTAYYFDEAEVLVAAKHLTGLEGVDIVDASEITYIHVMFAQHEVVLSNGSWTESFQPGDQTLRGIGDEQRAEILALFPELADADGIESYTAARRSLKQHEARLLVG